MRGGPLAWALLAVLVVAGTASPSRSEPLAVIVSERWERAGDIQLRDLRAVYLGSRTDLFGRRVRRIDFPSGSPLRQGFCLSVLGRPESELERYWIEQALAGGALPPLQLATAEEVIEAVRRRAGVLGYVPASLLRGAGADGVRALRVIVDGVALDAADPGYPIRSRP